MCLPVLRPQQQQQRWRHTQCQAAAMHACELHAPCCVCRAHVYSSIELSVAELDWPPVQWFESPAVHAWGTVVRAACVWTSRFCELLLRMVVKVLVCWPADGLSLCAVHGPVQSCVVTRSPQQQRCTRQHPVNSPAQQKPHRRQHSVCRGAPQAGHRPAASTGTAAANSAHALFPSTSPTRRKGFSLLGWMLRKTRAGRQDRRHSTTAQHSTMQHASLPSCLPQGEMQTHIQKGGAPLEAEGGRQHKT